MHANGDGEELHPRHVLGKRVLRIRCLWLEQPSLKYFPYSISKEAGLQRDSKLES